MISAEVGCEEIETVGDFSIWESCWRGTSTAAKRWGGQ